MNLTRLRRDLGSSRATVRGHTEAVRSRFSERELETINQAGDLVDPSGRADTADRVACLALAAARAVLSEPSAG